jgi:hypothetical protein
MNPSEPRHEAVAVITVHGVGNPPPYDTVRRIGDLLQDLDLDGANETTFGGACAKGARPAAPAYYPFREQPLRISVRPVVVTDAADEPAAGAGGPFHEWVGEMMDSPKKDGDEDLSIRFMRGQLRCYKGEDPADTYQTIRLEGARAERDGEPGRDVHLYELYWADLASVGAGVLSLFAELYQVLFHLSKVGTHTVDAAAVEHRTSTWKMYRGAQAWASRMLTVLIPIINLFMLAAAVVAMGFAGFKHAPVPAQSAVVGSILATAVAWGVGVFLWKHEAPAFVWSLPLAFWIAIAGGAALWGIQHKNEHVEWFDACESALIALAAGSLVALLIRGYNRTHPGTARWALWMAPISLAVGTVHLLLRPDKGTLAFWVGLFEDLSISLTLAWTVFFIFGFAALVLGFLAVRQVPKGPERVIAANSRWTAHMLLSLPAFVFMVVSIVVWGLVSLGALQIMPSIPYQAVIRKESKVLDEFIRQIVNGPAEQALPALLILAALSVLPAIWSIGPVIWREVFPPDPHEALQGNDSAHLGAWLTRAFFGLTLSGLILYIAMMIVMPVAITVSAGAYYSPGYISVPPWFSGILASKWLTALGVVSGAGFAWLAVAQKLAVGFRPAVSILLDIDTWLREYPLDSNPKARICGRYISLLRYVCNWRDPVTGQRYDKIVILSHSQGTVVSADLLRFIHAEAQSSGGAMSTYDPRLGRLDEIPIYFFTMGCPLRQMYGLRFPFLYRWARHEDESPMQKWSSCDLPPDQRPDPAELGPQKGLALWVNAYRSGDYIGRYLWRTDNCAYLWNGDRGPANPSDPAPYQSTDRRTRLEFCIGAGAHTHYWDRTAPMIARELDRLIGAG